MKLERGIIEGNSNHQLICAVGATYLVEKELVTTVPFYEGQKILGSPSGNIFNVCYEVKLKSGEVYTGYFVEELLDSKYKFQIVKDITLKFEYLLGEKITLNYNDLSALTSLSYINNQF